MERKKRTDRLRSLLDLFADAQVRLLAPVLEERVRVQPNVLTPQTQREEIGNDLCGHGDM